MAIYIDDEVVTKSKLFTLLDIPNNSIPAPREKRFQFPVRVDQDGNKRHLGRLMCYQYSVYIPSLNREVPIRWATQQKKDKDGNFEYFPTDNELKAGEAGEVLVNDDMMFLFWYINPANRQSPFRKPQGLVLYEFLDNDNLAKVSNSVDETRITAMSIVLGQNSWPVSRLRTLAKGMGIAGVNDMTDDVVKSQLKARAFKDPDKFINQAESREVAFTGKIQEAIDRNLIQLKTLNGMQRWYLKSNEIVPVQYGIDARKVLDDHLSEKWYMYSDEINRLLEGTSIANNLANPENDVHFEETGAIETASEAGDELWQAYMALRKDAIRLKKVEFWAKLDIKDPKMHPNQRKALVDNAEEIEMYRKGLELEKLNG